jgi:signal transduction histidine kinase
VLCVLPISAIFSFFSTRRLTGRIEKLTAATSTVRGGDYGVRIAVDGEDEIAHLQSDFNAMAVDLERTMGELKEERDHVATLLNARRELIANISHDLRTPVATVRSYLESTLVAWQSGQPPATLHQDMQIMEQQVTRLQTMINDLFTLSRAEVEHLEMCCVPTNVEQVIRRVVDAVAPMAWRASRVEVLTEYDLVEPSFPLALVDGNRLEQILHNLMHNAIRHTPPGGIIVIGLKAEGEQVAIQVKDTGEGIAADELPLIWERFYRARNVHTRPENGTGLGLAIVKELTESMGGTISVASIVGRGTCFTLRFLLAQDATQLRTAPLPASVRQ